MIFTLNPPFFRFLPHHVTEGSHRSTVSEVGQVQGAVAQDALRRCRNFRTGEASSDHLSIDNASLKSIDTAILSIVYRYIILSTIIMITRGFKRNLRLQRPKRCCQCHCRQWHSGNEVVPSKISPLLCCFTWNQSSCLWAFLIIIVVTVTTLILAQKSGSSLQVLVESRKGSFQRSIDAPHLNHSITKATIYSKRQVQQAWIMPHKHKVGYNLFVCPMFIVLYVIPSGKLT
jgi:hypothetical protein